jgi:competence protein ComEA
VSPTRAAVTGVALVAIIATGVWFLRPPPVAVEASLPFASSTSLSTTTPPTSTVVVVHVAGAVRSPGVIEMQPGSRIVDAIEAAGGASADAEVARLNLASPLTDGQQVYVPRAGEAVPTVPAPNGGDPSGSGDPSNSGPVNLNTATLTDLDALPGIGPTTAQAIIDWRAENGPFATVDDLLEVRGIGDAKLADLRDLVTV